MSREGSHLGSEHTLNHHGQGRDGAEPRDEAPAHGAVVERRYRGHQGDSRGILKGYEGDFMTWQCCLELPYG